jgi:thiol-disulfide isomerase/thioredoxin
MMQCPKRATFLTMQSTLHLKLLLGVLLCTRHVSNAFTNEPPGRDPASIETIRSSERAVVLTTDNFDELTEGKLVFIKFYSPFCPHCKTVAGAWDELASYYRGLSDGDDDDDKNNNNSLIGSIDCSDSPKGKDLCERFEIIGLPTLLYGDASLGGIYLEEYGGEKTFDDMKSFAAEALVPKCNPGRLDACPPDTRQEMESYMAMSYQALGDKIKGMEKNAEELKASFKTTFAVLQKKYDEIVTEKEIQISKAKANVKLMKEIIATKEL